MLLKTITVYKASRQKIRGNVNVYFHLTPPQKQILQILVGITSFMGFHRVFLMNVFIRRNMKRYSCTITLDLFLPENLGHGLYGFESIITLSNKLVLV